MLSKDTSRGDQRYLSRSDNSICLETNWTGDNLDVTEMLGVHGQGCEVMFEGGGTDQQGFCGK